MLKDNIDEGGKDLVKEEKTFNRKRGRSKNFKSKVYCVTFQMPKCFAWHEN